MKRIELTELPEFTGVTKQGHSSVPQLYRCSSIQDYLVNKEYIPEHLSTIVIPNVFLSIKYLNGNIESYIHEDQNESTLFSIEDKTGDADILWAHGNTKHLTSQKMVSFIRFPRAVDGVSLVYDKYFDNSFLFMIVEKEYQEALKQVFNEIGWN